jgi:SAM-dependent methyltransferase
MNGYRRQIFREMHATLSALGSIDGVLDVGAGDGWFANAVETLGICGNVTAVDVQARARCHHPVDLYDGRLLPFPDGAFDLVYAVDVVHHAIEPAKLLAEMARCTRRYLLLKDHTWHTRLGWLILAARDEAGNRPHGVRSVYNYQQDREWDAVLEANGMKQLQLLHPLACHVGPLGRLANHNEFLSLWTVEAAA